MIDSGIGIGHINHREPRKTGEMAINPAHKNAEILQKQIYCPMIALFRAIFNLKPSFLTISGALCLLKGKSGGYSAGL
jgi:hypothetical protein